MELQDDRSRAIELLRATEWNPENGLPQSLFLLVSGLIPIPNVDLLVVNEKNQLLLSRRNDEYFENSWHIPGGCMRFGEDFATRIQETAVRELQTKVTFEEEPIAVRSVVRGLNTKQKYPHERGHMVAILFKCKLPDGFQINNADLTEQDNGYLKWFDTLPEDFMKIQEIYADVLSDWKPKKENKYGNMEK